MSPTLTALAERTVSDPAAVTDFLTDAVLPLVEPVDNPDERLVTFVWHDADAEQVLLFANRLTDETRLPETLLSPLPGTDLWALSVVMRSDWRASYAFVVQRPGERAPWLAEGDQVQIRATLDRGHPDPHNPATCRNRAGVVQSVVALPDSPPQPFLVRRPGTPAGTLRSEALPGGREGWSWTAAGLLPPEAPLLLVLDGEVWTGPQDLPTTLDNLVADAMLPPCRALLVASGGREHRWAELGDDGTSYLTDDLLPWAQGRGWLPRDPRQVAVLGQSLGGLTALRLGLRRPDLCGTVLSQSASLWLDDLTDLVSPSTAPRPGSTSPTEVRSGCSPNHTPTWPRG
ncbi:enterochelin esterase domain-containing protein [Nocardioides alcanivorans]|uniref:enterochelin esterase domain-containing protein n=1 Tax=Nocardioides alcanivorans TaxID=2897352 RepID=UPI001F0122C2|nr:enterochelin esterase domain-containing protein [Nocardioides alcanivorans]